MWPRVSSSRHAADGGVPNAQHPVIIFVNKLDREGRDPFEILDELEAELKIAVRPLSWPINIGAKFKGVYNIYEHSLDLFTPSKTQVTERVEIENVDDPRIDEAVGEKDASKLREDLELIEGVYPELDVNEYLAGKVAPVFFGSALNTFGVKELLDCFVKIAPHPVPFRLRSVRLIPRKNRSADSYSRFTLIWIPTTAHV